ncbi:PDF (predicted) [Pycnogonum litorale]
MSQLLTTSVCVRQCCRRASTAKGFIGLYRQFMTPKLPSAPYKHACSVGDPVLRQIAQKVPIEDIDKPEIKKVIKSMVRVMRKLEIDGISAPQVGCSLQIIAVECTKQSFNAVKPEIAKTRGYEIFPLKIFINPRLDIGDDTDKITFSEGCASLLGYSASVPRYHKVTVRANDETGQPVTWTTEGWPARIIQHEVDHLNGRLYIDFMDPKTFQYDFWRQINYGRIGASKRLFFRF